MCRTLYEFNRYRLLRTHYFKRTKYRRISTYLNSYAVNLFLSSPWYTLPHISCAFKSSPVSRVLRVQLLLMTPHGAHGTVCRWGEWRLGKVVIKIFQLFSCESHRPRIRLWTNSVVTCSRGIVFRTQWFVIVFKTRTNKTPATV